MARRERQTARPTRAEGSARQRRPARGRSSEETAEATKVAVPAAGVTTARIYDAPAPGQGLRVLVMRLWPRGVKKGAVDLWLKELGARLDNLRAWNAGQVEWPEMRRRYLAGLGSPPASTELTRLRRLAAQQPVTLLCSCADESRCHRTVLRKVLTS